LTVRNNAQHHRPFASNTLNCTAWWQTQKCKQGSHSLAYKKIFPGLFQYFPAPPKRFRRTVVAQQCYITNKQQLLTLYIQFDSTIRRKTFITSCKETVQLAHSRNNSYIYFRDVTDSESESDRIRYFFQNPKSVGYLKSDHVGFEIFDSVQLNYFRQHK